MARIRTIKPEFFTSEDIVSLSAFARLLYVALWCEADREGRMYWKPKTFKMRYFPADDININELCEEVIDAGLVELYGDGLAFIPSFHKHQHINPRESASTLPANDACLTRDDASVTVLSPSVTHREEGKGKESKPTRGEAASPIGFAEFWSAYPKRRNRGDAEKAWRALKPDQSLLARILEAVEVAKTRDDWRKDGGQFIPYPASWLRAKGWEDEAAPASRPAQSRVFAGAI